MRKTTDQYTLMEANVVMQLELFLLCAEQTMIPLRVDFASVNAFTNNEV